MASTLDYYIQKLRCLERDIRSYFDIKAIEGQMRDLSVGDVEKTSLQNEHYTDPHPPKWKPIDHKAAPECVRDLRAVLRKRRSQRNRRRRKMVQDGQQHAVWISHGNHKSKYWR